MARLGGTPRMLPDQPVPVVDPEVERLAHLMVDGLIERLAAEPAVPATSLLDHLAEQLQQAASLRRLNVMRRVPGSTSAVWSPAQLAPANRSSMAGKQTRTGWIYARLPEGMSAAQLDFPVSGHEIVVQPWSAPAIGSAAGAARLPRKPQDMQGGERRVWQ